MQWTNPELLKAWAAVISAAAQLLWPAVALIALFVFRKPLTRILGRLKRGKLFGNEIELEAQVEQLSRKAEQVETSLKEIPPRDSLIQLTQTTPSAVPSDGYQSELASPPAAADTPPRPKIREEIAENQESLDGILGGSSLDEIITTGQISPSTGILLLSAQLERRVNYFLAAQGLWSQRTHFFVRNIELLCKKELLPLTLGDLARTFWTIRNKVAHGSRSPNSALASAFQSGVTLYKAILDMPYPVIRVLHAGLPLYRDKEATEEVSGKAGVILLISSRSLATESLFPAPIEAGYQPGQLLSWEWANEEIAECWYRDPKTGLIVRAWQTAPLFAGQSIIGLLDR
jgi:hypothetical protein